jgi:hypothetical protein
LLKKGEYDSDYPRLFVLPTRDKDPFTLTEFGTLTLGIEDFKSEDVFMPVREDLPDLKL